MSGTRDLAAYAALAQLHRPTDPAAIDAEIRRLGATGLKPRDIATAMGLAERAVVAALDYSVAQGNA
jgi:hypothetical protein